MPISAEVVNVCITIRRSRSIKTPDAIIAATAIVNKLILITGDKGFENIVDLEILNPFEI